MGSTEPDAMTLLRVTAARHMLGLLYSWEFPPLADTLLNRGVYSRSLAELAAITTPRMADVEPLLVATLKELEEPVFSSVDAAWFLVRHCIERIAQSDEPPRVPLELLTRVSNSSATQNVLPNKVFVGDGLDLGSLIGIYYSYAEPSYNVLPSGRVITDEAERQSLLDKWAREEAVLWLARHPSSD